jgi:hypothetical protein
MMEERSGFSVNCCDDANRAAALHKIFMLSKMTWNEIQNAPRHGLGTEKISGKDDALQPSSRRLQVQRN